MKLCLSITELPLSKFINAEVDGDLSGLVIEGNPTLAQLSEAWAEIKEQYIAAIGSPVNAKYLSLYKKFIRHQTNYTCAIQLVDVLSAFYAVEFARELDAILYTKLNLNPQDRTDYYRKLSKASNMIKSLAVKLELMRRQVEQDDSSETHTPTREYFQNYLIALSDYVKYRISDDISTFEYCTRVKALNAAIRKAESEKRKKNGRR